MQEALGGHPAFVPVLEWQFETAPFFVECAYGGQNWLEWAEERGGLAGIAVATRLDWMIQLCRAVAAAHSAGVLNKDLKPANALIEAEGQGHRVRLTDFGAGRIDAERLSEWGITGLGFTQTQAVNSASSSGTPLYLAPEVIAGQVPTVQSDVYSLGVMLYQLMAGDFHRPMAPGWEADIDDPLLREDIAAAAHGNPAQRLPTVQQLLERLETLEARRTQREQQQAAEARAQKAEQALAKARARRPFVVAAIASLVIGFCWMT